MNGGFALHFRLLGLQAARQLWDDEVETTVLGLLADNFADIRRLAVQALAWEPKAADARLLPKLIEKLDDVDPRVAREAALAVARHSEGKPALQSAAVLVRWLYAHPKADPTTRDGFLRALDRMGEPGVEEVALAIRTRRADERATAVSLFTGLRSAQAAEQLASLVRVPDLAGPERLALIRMFADIPLEIPVTTGGLAEFVSRRRELDPASKVAALDACRLAGNPASNLVLVLLDDEDESVRLAATELAGRSRPPGAMKLLAERLADADRSDAERLAILRALRQAGPAAFAAIDAASLASDDAEFRLAALRALSSVDRPKAIPALQAALAGPDPALRAEAVRILGESHDTAVLLGRSALDRSVPRGDLPEVLAALRRHDGPEIRKIRAQIEAEAEAGAFAPDLGEIRSRVESGADAWAGLGVFFRETSARCSACHKVEGFGKAEGLAIAPGMAVDKLLAAVVRHPARGGNRTSPARPVSLSTRAVAKPADPADPSRPDLVGIELAPDDIADLVAFPREQAGPRGPPPRAQADREAPGDRPVRAGRRQAPAPARQGRARPDPLRPGRRPLELGRPRGRRRRDLQPPRPVRIPARPRLPRRPDPVAPRPGRRPPLHRRRAREGLPQRRPGRRDPGQRGREAHAGARQGPGRRGRPTPRPRPPRPQERPEPPADRPGPARRGRVRAGRLRGRLARAGRGRPAGPARSRLAARGSRRRRQPGRCQAMIAP